MAVRLTQNLFEETSSTWTLVPLATPCVWRSCPRCGQPRPFESSGRFRLNANKRRVDGWLIYRCPQCDATWNREIVARRSPREIGADLLSRLEQNDAETAWRYAFDVASLASQGMRIDEPPIRVDRIPVPAAGDVGVDGSQTIRIRLPVRVVIRLDRLLANELELSRSAIQGLFERGALCTDPAGKATLRKPVRDGQVIQVMRSAVQAMSREQHGRKPSWILHAR